jgi:hypothetical protein
VFTTGSIYTYEYSSQAPIKIVDEDGFVDLSSEANINGTETVYTWVVDEPDFDSDGVLANEEILYGTDNEYGEEPEYRIDNGVTRFFGKQTHIACVLTNDLFPNLTLQTTLINTGGAAVNDIVADSANVYVDVDGTNVYAYAPNGNIAKLYSVNGALQASAATADGVASFKNVAPGYYLVTVANKAIKIIVK